MKIKDLNYITNYYSLPKFEISIPDYMGYVQLHLLGYHSYMHINLRYYGHRGVWAGFSFEKPSYGKTRKIQDTRFHVLLAHIIRNKKYEIDFK